MAINTPRKRTNGAGYSVPVGGPSKRVLPGDFTGATSSRSVVPTGSRERELSRAVLVRALLSTVPGCVPRDELYRSTPHALHCLFFPACVIDSNTVPNGAEAVQNRPDCSARSNSPSFRYEQRATDQPMNLSDVCEQLIAHKERALPQSRTVRTALPVLS